MKAHQDESTKHDRPDLPTPEPEFSPRHRNLYRFSTICATVDNPDMKDQYGSSSVPIYQSATFKGIGNSYDYSRSGNPTRSHLEHHIAKISSADHAFVVASGMAALDIILRLLKPGDEVIAGDDLYGGTNRLLGYIHTHLGVTVHHVDTTDPLNLDQFIHPTKTAMVLLESPTNPLLKIVDLAFISKVVKERAQRAVVVVDNTMMSPYLQRPLEHGVDIVYDSATKYLSGHHDLMAGAIVCNRNDLAKHLAFTINAVGNGLSPVDAFLLLRGVKTLALRMDRQQSNAQAVAEFLDNIGFCVHYPGLRGHPRREVHEKFADGFGAVLSFETGLKSLSERVVASTRLWGISVSFGCVNSLISMPCVMSHSSIDAETRAARGLPEDLIRLCVGIEDADDLINDLENALVDAGAIEFDPLCKKYVRISQLKKGQALLLAPTMKEPEWIVSAPGKVILFGEHAVVHGVTAIAASIDLRCYGLLSCRQDGKISVHLHEIENFYCEWATEELPWDAVPVSPSGDEAPDGLDQNLISAITNGPLRVVDNCNQHARAASLAFLYLYLSLTNGRSRVSLNFSARSTIPVGAGLGSSASFSTCAAAGLLLLSKRIVIPKAPAASLNATGHAQIPLEVAKIVNQWAFIAEKILHGDPSGVDNSVAVYGGALAYTRPGYSMKSGMEPIRGFKSLRFLLTNSKMPRNTKQLVAEVARKKLNDPDFVDGVLDAIQKLTDEARRALSNPDLPRDTLLSVLSVLIQENHKHLVSLGVSHPALETIRTATASEPYRLSTKLTGAGGGGCSVTLIPDDFQAQDLQKLMDTLIRESFQPYHTSVGGTGLGFLSFHHDCKFYTSSFNGMHSVGQITPPESPTPSDSNVSISSLLSQNELEDIDFINQTFETIASSDLRSWADGLGHWIFV